MDRKEILENAINHTCGDRDDEYGPPDVNFANIARLWNAYLQGRYIGAPTITAEDVAQFLVLLKMARSFTAGVKPDTFEDEAAYAAIAGQLAMAAPEERKPAALAV